MTRMTTGASLNPDSASRMPAGRRVSRNVRNTENTAAASVDDTIAPTRTATCHDTSSSAVRRHRRHEHADADPHRGEHAGHRDRRPDVVPARRQAALREDEDERGKPQYLRQCLVVEVDAEDVLTEQQADREVEQQARETRARRQADGDDREQQDPGPDEQHEVELLDRHVRLPSQGPSGAARDVGDIVKHHAAAEDLVWQARAPPAHRRRRPGVGAESSSWSGWRRTARGQCGAPSLVPTDKRRSPHSAPTSPFAAIEYGIPQIYADTAEDLFRAQGYVHAQDRFFEMDLRRHITAGRLAELFGEDQVETDTFLRTLGWRRVAEEELPTLAAGRPGRTSRPTPTASTPTSSSGRRRRAGRGVRLLGLSGVDYGARAVDAGRLAGLAQGDGLGPARQHAGPSSPGPGCCGDVARCEQIEELYPPYPYDRHQPILPGYDRHRLRAGRQTAAPPCGHQHDGPAERSSAGRVDAVAGADALRRRVRCSAAAKASARTRGWSAAPDEHRQAAARQRPPPRAAVPSIWYQMGLHCREVSSLPLRRRRLHVLRRARASSSATTTASPGA